MQLQGQIKITLVIFFVLMLLLVRLIKRINSGPSSYKMNHIDKMSGKEFEDFVSKKYKAKGYKVKQIGGVGDFGADLIIEKRGIKTAVQAKRYNYKVDQKAIQQVFAAWYYYDCKGAIVVTNSYYTRSAQKLANKIHVKLIDRDSLLK